MIHPCMYGATGVLCGIVNSFSLAFKSNMQEYIMGPGVSTHEVVRTPYIYLIGSPTITCLTAFSKAFWGNFVAMLLVTPPKHEMVPWHADMKRAPSFENLQQNT